MEFRVSNIRMAIDPETGEVDEDARIITKEMDEAITKNKAKNMSIAVDYAMYGQFYWLLYSIQKPLFDGLIDGSTATRLIYLATYMPYNGYRLTFDNNAEIHVGDLNKLLGLDRTNARRFLKKCKDAKLLFVNDDNTIDISKEYFARGKIKPFLCKKERDIIRIYINSVRELYEKSKEENYKALVYLFMLLPYVNKQYNCVCFNPNEEELENIKPMTLQECCDILGYNAKNAYRLRQFLFKIFVGNRPAIVLNRSAIGETVFVNPGVYYAGSRSEEVRILGAFN